MGIGKPSFHAMPYKVRELHLAVMRNDIQRVRQLVDAGIDVNFPWQNLASPSVKDGSTPLCEAVSLNHRLIVEELINSGAFINKPDGFGYTPLHKSSYHGRAILTASLIHAGADVQLCDRNHSTPLVICAQNFIIHNNLDTIQILLKAGSNVNSPNECGKIALHYAVMWGLMEMINLLLQADSDIDFMDSKRQTPLFCLLQTIDGLHKKRSVFELHLPSVKLLVISGCDTLNLGEWLFQNDIITDEYRMDEEFYAWYCGSRPGSLKHLCRAAIMKHLKNGKMTNLPLPLTLVKYLSRKLLCYDRCHV